MFKEIHRQNADALVVSGRDTRMRSEPISEVPKPDSQRFIKSTSYLGPVAWQSLPSVLRLVTDPDYFKNYGEECFIKAKIWSNDLYLRE